MKILLSLMLACVCCAQETVVTKQYVDSVMLMAKTCILVREDGQIFGSFRLGILSPDTFYLVIPDSTLVSSRVLSMTMRLLKSARHRQMFFDERFTSPSEQQNLLEKNNGISEFSWSASRDKIKLIISVIVMVWTFLSAFTAAVWAVTDKTLFWARFDVASTQLVQELKSDIADLIQSNEQLLAEVRTMNNARILDRWVQIVDSPRFTDPEEAIKDGVFVRKTISADSLGTLLRDKITFRFPPAHLIRSHG